MAKGIITFCNCCKEETNHLCLFCKKVVHIVESDDQRHPDIKDQEEYMVVQCKGCNTVSFLRKDSGDSYQDNDGNPYCLTFNFPESEHVSVSRLLSQEEQNNLPKRLARLYEELELAFSNEANMLAGVGLRMLVEAICLEQEISDGNLRSKIIKLHEKGLISKNEIPILDKLREMGNASAHEIKSFSLDKLDYALDILNHVLKSIYILPEINRKLKL